MDNEVLEQIFDQRQELLSLPQTLVEVLRVVQDESSSNSDLATILSRDPALTARVLRIVNSAYYGGNRQVGNMDQAVMLIGVRQITALALSSSVYQIMQSWEDGIDRIRFWRHSLEVAIASRMIAEKINFSKADEIFVAGLLHDIGLLILEQAFPESYHVVRESSIRNESLIDREENRWGTNHARVGSFVLEQWRLPEVICEGVGRHHVTFTAGTTTADLFPGQIVGLANLIAQFRITEMPVPEIDQREEIKAIIMSNLGLDISAVCDIQKRLFHRTLEEAKYLEIEIGSADALLEESNRLLFQQYAAVERLLVDRRDMQRQVARGRLQNSGFDMLRTATSAYARYLTRASNAIYAQTDDVRHALQEGTISDPKGLVARSAERILETISAVRELILEMEAVTGIGNAMVDEQQYLEMLDRKLGKKLMPTEKTSATS